MTLVGQAGVGKSRILREFERCLTRHESEHAVRTGRCLVRSPHAAELATHAGTIYPSLVPGPAQTYRICKHR